MIDDKKIEEAAVKSTNYLKGICDFTVINASEEGFKAGAKWAINEFIKDLWHPASEEPEKNRRCLIMVVYHLNHGMLPDEERIEQSSFHDFGWYDYNFKYIGTNYDIISWLYVEDLLPKEGGKQ